MKLQIFALITNKASVSTGQIANLYDPLVAFNKSFSWNYWFSLIYFFGNISLD